MASSHDKLYIAKTAQEKFFLKSLPFLWGKVLDIGCGSQPFKQYFSDYVGIDIAEYSPTVAADGRYEPAPPFDE